MIRTAPGVAGAPARAATSAAVLCMASAPLFARAAAAAGGDPVVYTLMRITTAAVVLAALRRLRGGGHGGSWSAAGLLVLCSIASTAALRTLDAGAGALMFFATVQLLLTGEDVVHGRARDPWSLGGTASVLAGLALLVRCGSNPVPFTGALLMVIGGVAWAAYTRRGRSASDPFAATTGNVVRAVPLAALAAAPELCSFPVSLHAAGMAAAAGLVATAVGGVLWYHAVARLTSACAGAAQSMVPVVAGLGGAALLGEGLGVRQLAATAIVVSGVAMVARGSARPTPAPERPVRLIPSTQALETAV